MQVGPDGSCLPKADLPSPLIYHSVPSPHRPHLHRPLNPPWAVFIYMPVRPGPHICVCPSRMCRWTLLVGICLQL